MRLAAALKWRARSPDPFRDMTLILGVVLILSGALMVVSGLRLAKRGAVVVNEAIALFWIYLGVRFLAG